VIPTMPDGEFFDCSNPESLTHTDPWSAIEEYLDGWLSPKMTVADVLREIRKPITITAYVPGVVDDAEIKNWAESLTETLEERFGEEHGDPDGQHPLCKDAEAIMLEAVTKIVKASRVWSCAESGHVNLTPDQVEELARENRPDWFKEPEAA